MGFFRNLKNWSDKNKKRKQETDEKKPEIEQRSTEEQSKNNKKGKLAYLWAFISIVVYVLGFGLVFTAWSENIALGIMALLLALTITPIAHRKAIELAKEQRKINGKGLGALIFATLIPTAVLIGFFFFFVLGGVYNII